MNLRITGITALKQYRELVSAIWCCPIDEVEQSDITHESSIKEVERQIDENFDLKKKIARLESIISAKYKINVKNPLFKGLVAGKFDPGTELATITELAGQIESLEEEIKELKKIKQNITTSDKPKTMFGTYSWAGIYQGLPAIVLSYHGGAELWVLSNEKWQSIAKGSSEQNVIPRKCEKCGSQIPIISESE